MSKVPRKQRPRGKSALFQLHYEALSTLYGAPRTSINDGLKREYFDLGDGRVIMFASPHKE